jgi:hypothetical protein
MSGVSACRKTPSISNNNKQAVLLVVYFSRQFHVHNIIRRSTTPFLFAHTQARTRTHRRYVYVFHRQVGPSPHMGCLPRSPPTHPPSRAWPGKESPTTAASPVQNNTRAHMLAGPRHCPPVRRDPLPPRPLDMRLRATI